MKNEDSLKSIKHQGEYERQNKSTKRRMEGKKISHLKLENDYQSAQQPTLNMAESVVHGVPNANSMTRKSTS